MWFVNLRICWIACSRSYFKVQNPSERLYTDLLVTRQSGKYYYTELDLTHPRSTLEYLEKLKIPVLLEGTLMVILDQLGCKFECWGWCKLSLSLMVEPWQPAIFVIFTKIKHVVTFLTMSHNSWEVRTLIKKSGEKRNDKMQ